MKITHTPSPIKINFDKALTQLDKKELKVGWFDSAKYPDGTSVAYVATIQEFGSPEQSIPARPFMRPTIAEKENAWKQQFKSGAKAVLHGSETAETVFEKIGLGVAGNIRTTITKLQTPPLKPATVQARRNKMADTTTTGNLTKPLVFTKILLNSLTHNVEDKS